MGQRHDRHFVRAASRFRRACRDIFPNRRYSLGLGYSGRDNAVAELARERERLGSIGRDVKWNPIVEIYEAPVAMQIFYFSAEPLGVVGRLALVEQVVNHAH